MSQTKAQLIDPVDGTIVNADINASAAIAGTKISPNFGSQNTTTTGVAGVGELQITSTAPKILFIDSDTNPDYEIRNLNGAFNFRDTTNDSIRLSVNSSTTVINEGGDDVDFRVEGNGEANLFFVDAANQRIGIGTNSPSQKLHIVSSAPAIQFEDTGANGSAISVIEDNNGFLKLRCDAGNAGTGSGIGFEVDASEIMRIDSSGRLLLGTTTEGVANASKFTIATSAHCGMTVRSGAAHDGQIAFSDGTSGDDEFRGQVRYNHTSNFFAIATDATERVRIDSSGRVGIGLTAPTSLLHVKDTSGDCQAHIEAEAGNDAVLLLDTSNGSGATADVRFAMDGTTKGKISFLNAGGTAGDMVFSVGSNTERMRLASDGDLGVGISSVITSRIHAVDGNTRNTPHFIFDATATTGTNNDGDLFMIRSGRGTGNVNPLLHVLTSTSTTVLSVTGDKRVSIQGAPTTSNFGAKFQVRESGQQATTLTALFGANENASGTNGGISDNTNKACRIGLPHYDTDQKAAAMFVGFAGNGVNELYLGGGTGVMNAATSVRVYADSSSSVNNGGNQVARFDSDGLKFGTDTAAANALDDYEEGSFTPGSNASLTTAAGFYTKIGRQVTLHIRVTVASQSSGSPFEVNNFPFTSGMSGTTSNGAVPNGFGYISSGSVIPQIHHIHDGTKTQFYNFNNFMTISNFSGKELRFGLIYYTA